MRRAVLLTALVCLLVPAAAVASKSGGQRLIRDCASDGEINGSYSQADYKYALDHLPSDLDEYTNCRDAIRAAQAAAAGRNATGGGGGSGGVGGSGGGFGGGAFGGGSVAPGFGAIPQTGGAVSPAERSAIAGARSAGGAVAIGGGTPVTPGGPGITVATVTRALPAPLFAVLVLLLLAGIGGAIPAVRTRVLTRRQA